MITDYPTGKCPSCGGDSWWYRMAQGANAWVCGACHPPTDPITALRSRAIRGNYKLHIALKKIYAMKVGEERDRAMETFNQALGKLKLICDELVACGATECLFIENGKKVRRCVDNNREFYCSACPNDYWWSKELIALDEASESHVR